MIRTDCADHLLRKWLAQDDVDIHQRNHHQSLLISDFSFTAAGHKTRRQRKYKNNP